MSSPPNNRFMDPADPTIRGMKALLELGGTVGFPMDIMGQVFATFSIDRPVPMAVLRYTFGPLIVHSTEGPGNAAGIGWLTRAVIDRWTPRVHIERLEIFCAERPDLVSPTEIWLVMHNAMMTAPMQHDITQIYLWACVRATIAAGKADSLPTEMRPGANLRGQQPLATDEQVFEGHLAGCYREVCEAIIRKVVAHSKIGAPRAAKPRSG